MDWLRKLLQPKRRQGDQQQQGDARHQGPAHERDEALGHVELLKAADRDAIVVEHLSQYLPTLGLGQIAPRTWIDGSTPPARRMFSLSLLKGASMKATWGFSLDFVPHFSGSQIRWHRSDKTARLDVYIDPKDLLQPSYLFGAARLHHDLKRLLPDAVERAEDTWRRGATERGMLTLIQEIREHKTNCLGFYNYTQLPLAHAFLSARLGDLASAEREVDEYISLGRFDEVTAAKLKRLVWTSKDSRGTQK
jgi:hypothetical protein